MVRRKTNTPTEEIKSPQSKKDFINSVIKKKQRSKFLTENQREYYNKLISNQITICSSNSSRNMFSLRSVKYSDKNEAGCLIIVPHTLFRQWSAYIKEQTNINAYITKR